MKTSKQLVAALAGACISYTSLAQAVLPGSPEDSGATPKTDTLYLNAPPNQNNASTESLGVAIANNGNVIVGWEDDGDGITDQEATWTLLSTSGTGLIPEADLASLVFPDVFPTKFRSYFRADKSPTPPFTSWGPKIKANLFGDGIGMGATSFALNLEIPEFQDVQIDSDGPDDAGAGSDFPSVQLLTNDGQPVAAVSGVADAFAETAGNIRIGDWDYLSNGNIVVVGESRQNSDLADKFGGAAGGKHAIFRIIDKTGKEIKAESLVSENAVANEIWHGVGVTKNGFAVRFGEGGRATVRLFNNAGAPITGNIDLGTLTGHEIAASGGRGDGAGFHGNGKDSYVAVSTGADDGKPQVSLTVLKDDGTLRFWKPVVDDVELKAATSADAGIDASGRVFVVFGDKGQTDGFQPLVLGRMFDAKGAPITKTFYVSEKEIPDPATMGADSPRAFWRGDLAAVTWRSKNSPDTADAVVAVRLFTTFKPGSAEGAGLTRILADTPVIVPAGDALGNWEPYTSVLGTTDFLIEGSTFAQDSTDHQRYVVMVQPVTGAPGKLVEAFYADDGTPFKGAINASRQNGNPGRVAGDKRPGAVHYITGGEASPHTLAEFGSDNRWNLGFDRLADGRYATVQTYALNTSTLATAPLGKAQDSANGRLTSGDSQGNNQISRYGGELAGLDNGNFVSVVEDRSKVRNPNGNAAVATIFAPDGSVVKDSWKVADGDLWSNVAAYKGGFAVRVAGIIYFHDNAGNLKGQVDQIASGDTGFDRGRGDGTRIASHINSPFVFLAGVAAGRVRLAAFDSRDFTAAGLDYVDEPGFAGAWDRIGLAVDALNRVVVGGVVKPAGYLNQQVAARVMSYNSTAKTFSALTPSFFAFVNVGATDIRTLQMNPSMTTKQILIAAKGEINLDNKPDLGVTSPREVNFYTILSHPNPQDDPTAPVSSELKITSAVKDAAGVKITWAGGTAPFLLQGSPAVGQLWVNLATTADRTITIPAVGPAMFLRIGDATTANIKLYRAALTGAAEKPNPVATTGSGVAFVSVDGLKLTYFVSYSGLSSAVTASHIHGSATAAQTAGVIVPFAANNTGFFGGVATITQAQADMIAAGLTYVNIHTSKNGGGELRGQLLP